ncbi:MAG: MBL fold metallo-hydrolase [Tenericutes bacterium]|nr:MBL fold metallo-hydrolase [Mycoplasmatota bacterium]
MMKLKKINQNLAQVNSYILFKNSNCIVIDPGFNGASINDFCKEKGLSINYVLLTHGHFDHIKDLNLLEKTHQFAVYMSKDDKRLLLDDGLNYARAYGMTFKPIKQVVEYLSDKQTLNLLDEQFKIYSTPGHTKGSICIKYNKKLFSGDTLFFDSIGRTDLYSGNNKEIHKSLALLKTTISNETIVYPGHGDSGSMKEIKQNNPYL